MKNASCWVFHFKASAEWTKKKFLSQLNPILNSFFVSCGETYLRATPVSEIEEQTL